MPYYRWFYYDKGTPKVRNITQNLHFFVMQNTAGFRVRKWREHKQLSATDFARLTGVKYSTLKSLEDGGQPSFETMQKLRAAFPDLSTDWIFDDTETTSMFRDGRALTPAPAPRPVAAPAAADYGADLVAQVENVLLREQLAAATRRESADRETIQHLWAELGKSPGSADAAAGYFPTPMPPRRAAGFQLANAEVAQQMLAASFGAQRIGSAK